MKLLIFLFIITFQLNAQIPKVFPKPFKDFMKKWVYLNDLERNKIDSVTFLSYNSIGLPPWELDTTDIGSIFIVKLKSGEKIRMINFKKSHFQYVEGKKYKIIPVKFPKKNYLIDVENSPNQQDTTILKTFFGDFHIDFNFSPPEIVKDKEEEYISIPNLNEIDNNVKGSSENITFPKKIGQPEPKRNYFDKWIFKVPQTVENVKLIEFKTASFECNDPKFSAAVFIVEKENGQKIRVIDFCNTYKKFELGKTYKMIPMFFPNANYTVYSNEFPNNYDIVIKDTFYAKILY